MAKKKEKLKTIDDLRHNEYYGMQEKFDDLYAKSKQKQTFDDLISIILDKDNILLAYRNIKTNGGSKTPGTDGLNIEDIAKLSPEEVVSNVRKYMVGSKHGYRPKPVRRKEIPKPNGKTRPLGIPCIWDRLIQQCIKQVMEPICEAQFSDNSYGFRPLRSVEHAISKVYAKVQLQHLYHVIEFDIKGFFDNVDHQKLIKQIWALGIHDKKLIWIIKQILKAPIKWENGKIIYPEKGTPQGGILSPLLANIVLNELDAWVESQWQRHPVTLTYKPKTQRNGMVTCGHGYRGLRETTNLKEMWIVRYADDFRIFCSSHENAVKIKEATTQWLAERLKLEVSQEKTRIVDIRDQYMEFLGFKIKAEWNNQKKKYTVSSHISDKALADKTQKLVEQMKKVCSNPGIDQEIKEIAVYNAMVMGIQNYYMIATHVASDLNHVQQLTYHIAYNRLNTQTGQRLRKKGRELTQAEKQRYGKYKSIRYVKGSNEPLYPIYAVSFKTPVAFNYKHCPYTEEGRMLIHDKLSSPLKLLNELRMSKSKFESVEQYDNKLSLYSAQYGKCYVLDTEFQEIDQIHCHHKIPKHNGGTDEYSNLVLIDKDVHVLVHAQNVDTIKEYLERLRLNSSQMRKLNYLRFKAKLPLIKCDKLEHVITLEETADFLEI